MKGFDNDEQLAVAAAREMAHSIKKSPFPRLPNPPAQAKVVAKIKRRKRNRRRAQLAKRSRWANR